MSGALAGIRRSPASPPEPLCAALGRQRSARRPLGAEGCARHEAARIARESPKPTARCPPSLGLSDSRNGTPRVRDRITRTHGLTMGTAGPGHLRRQLLRATGASKTTPTPSLPGGGASSGSKLAPVPGQLNHSRQSPRCHCGPVGAVRADNVRRSPFRRGASKVHDGTRGLRSVPPGAWDAGRPRRGRTDRSSVGAQSRRWS